MKTANEAGSSRQPESRGLMPFINVFADVTVEGWIHDELVKKLGREPTQEEIDRIVTELPERVSRRVVEDLVRRASATPVPSSAGRGGAGPRVREVK